MRSYEQMIARLDRDRAELRRGMSNYHYENMSLRREKLLVSASELHYDDGRSELCLVPKFNWRLLYGYGPPEESVQTAASRHRAMEK